VGWYPTTVLGCGHLPPADLPLCQILSEVSFHIPLRQALDIQQQSHGAHCVPVTYYDSIPKKSFEFEIEIDINTGYETKRDVAQKPTHHDGSIHLSTNPMR
jgi:hypothetical protein